MNLFTYGTLMYPEVFYGLIKSQQYEAIPTTLKGYARMQVKNRRYPGLLASAGSDITGLTYLKVQPEDIKILNSFEGTEYTPIQVQVETKEGQHIKALAYLYGDPSNLQSYQWNMKQFENNHKSSFASDHLESQTN